MDTAYSSLKIFHHPDIVAKLKRGEHQPPIHVQIVPTNRCNQNCKGCAYRMDGYDSSEDFHARDEIPWSKLHEIVNDCKMMGVKAIEVTGGGEPTIHPQFLDFCSHILDSGIDLGVVTNGVKWSDEHTKLLRRAHWVRFSLDAGTPETYASWRGSRPEVYTMVREHIQSLSKLKQRHSKLLIGVGFVVSSENWQEVVRAAQAARDDGAHNFRISALFQPEDYEYFREWHSRARDLCQQAEKMAQPGFHVFNLFNRRIQDTIQRNPEYSFCSYSHVTTYLGADQNAYTCCCNAYNKRGLLGSFRESSFRQLWDDNSVRIKLASIDARKCPRCMYRDKNITINYATHNDPQHVNFI